jgi:hypothetical protein
MPDAEEEDEVEDYSDMEGVQREGLFDSRHAPPAGEPDYITQAKAGEGRKEQPRRGTVRKRGIRKARNEAREEKEKGKGKEAGREPGTRANTEPVAPRTILKRPEPTRWEKMEALRRWRAGNLTEMEAKVARAASAHMAKQIDEEEGGEKRTTLQAALEALQEWWDEGRPDPSTASALQTKAAAPRSAAPRATMTPEAAAPSLTNRQQAGAMAPRTAMASWAQRAAEAAALPEEKMQQVGKKGKPVKETTGLQRISGSIPVDERWIAFERTAGAPQISATVAASATGHVNIALSRVAPAHVRTEAFRITDRGSLTASARMGASAAMLLRFKKEILQAARKADGNIINVVSCESWVELRILVLYGRYRGKNGLDELREAIEAENQGVSIPPLSMKWMKAVHNYEQQWQSGTLPGGKASVIFKVPNKAAGQRLLKEIWVAGNRFWAETYVPSKADSLYAICSR